jgi:hypothetical protein
MLAAFGVEVLGVPVREPRKGESDWNSASSTGPDPHGSIYAGVPIAFIRPVWRVDIFGSTESPPGTLDRAHHHPRFDGWEPGPRHFVAELSADPPSWLAD